MCNSRFKFRAWDECNKIMHHNFQFIKSGDENNDWIVFTSDKQKLSDKPHPFENPYFQLQLKLMQYTGLLDKNGKEIYEGDIIKDLLTNAVYLVKIGFCKKYAFTGVYVEDSDGSQNMINNDYDQKSNSNIEIIGNIYENPELLNP